MAFTSNFQKFSRDFTDPASKAWRAGKGPDRGTLGPNRKSDTDPTAFKDNFVAEITDNPGYKNFYNGSVFGADTAALSREQYKNQSNTTTSTFKNPKDNILAKDFLAKYSEGVSSGLVLEEDAVTPENLKAFISEPAAARISDKDPNTVNKFPSQGISV
jgi:hypothetical protein